MAFIEWKGEWNLGFKEIDAQHKKLVELINEANEVFRKGNVEEEGKVFNELIELARVHFSTEEKYFEEFDYEDKEEHMKIHADLIETLLNERNKFGTGDFDKKEFLNFCAEWFDDHCNNYDKGYVECFKEHGLK